MKTQEEIVARIQARREKDPFGFEISEYLRALGYAHAKPFLKPDVKMEDWQPDLCSDEAVRAAIRAYAPFAWGKANGKRGISANRSIQHYIAWIWLIDEEFADQIDHRFETNYAYYGKDILVSICEHYDIDWRALDDGTRVNA